MVMAVSVERTQCFSYTFFLFCLSMYNLTMSRSESEIEQVKLRVREGRMDRLAE